MTETKPGSTFSTGPVDAEKNPEQFYRQAHWLARCSLFVYPPDDNPKEADAAAAKRIKGLIKSWGLDWDRFEFISNKSTQCFVAGNDHVIVVCFRGTEKSRWDVLSDLVAIQSGEGIDGRAHTGFINALAQAWDARGKAQAWDERGELKKEPGLRYALERLRKNDQKVWFTGHSLGGALAELAAARLIKEDKLSPEHIGGIITFGQPRVGDGEFASTYDREYGLKKRHVRFVNNNDIVTRTPLGGFKIAKLKLPEFRHVGRVVFINRKGEFTANIGVLRLAFGRVASRFTALLMKPMEGQKTVPVTGMKKAAARFLPGLSDHSMTRYEDALKNKSDGVQADT